MIEDIWHAMGEGSFWIGLAIGFFLGAWTVMRDQQNKELKKQRDKLFEPSQEP